MCNRFGQGKETKTTLGVDSIGTILSWLGALSLCRTFFNLFLHFVCLQEVSLLYFCADWLWPSLSQSSNFAGILKRALPTRMYVAQTLSLEKEKRWYFYLSNILYENNSNRCARRWPKNFVLPSAAAALASAQHLNGNARSALLTVRTWEKWTLHPITCPCPQTGSVSELRLFYRSSQWNQHFLYFVLISDFREDFTTDHQNECLSNTVVWGSLSSACLKLYRNDLPYLVENKLLFNYQTISINRK